MVFEGVFKKVLFISAYLMICSAAYAEVFSSKKQLTVLTWNIGHFAQGNKMNSDVTSADFEKKMLEYRHLIYDEIKPDVICLNEYSAVFAKDKHGNEQEAASVLFDGFKTQTIGDQRWYSYNALFSKNKMRRATINDFNCCQSYLLVNPKANQYYYISANIYINGEKIELVCVHLYPWDSEIREKQIKELIDRYNKTSRVVMCGDWNTTDYTQFKNAGYSLANDGSYVTYPSSRMALDNIIVKGLEISNVRLFETELSDHYPLVCSLSIN